MDDTPSPSELRTAARACTLLAYAAGLAGVTAGTLVLRDGDVTFAIITWVITFAVGASMMGVAVLVRAIAGLTATVAQLESDVRVLVADRGEHTGLRPEEHDPWSGHPPY